MKNNKSVLSSWFSKSREDATIVKSAHKFNPTLELERQIGSQIYNALQGSVVEEVLSKSKVSGHDAYWRSNMEGHSLKVDKELLPDFYNLCHEVKRKLNFDEPVDFYITGDSSVNAFSLASEEEGTPHIINVNSALFDLMNDDELRFVIGHELGHLINRDTALAHLINFVFPSNTKIPITLQYKIRLHDQLAELVADRYGFIAIENLSVCVTSFFKMASGLDLAKMNVSIDALIADNNRRLDFFLNDKGVSRASHPVNPIRVQALNLFATSESEEVLDKGMDELIAILLKVGTGELDESIAMFIATAGLVVAGVDSKVSVDEVKRIVEELAGFKIFPRQYFDELAQGDIGTLFNNSVMSILNVNPGMRDDMLMYMIGIVLSDKIIAKEEVDLLYSFGQQIGFSEMEVASAIARSIQQSYVPSLDSIV